MKKIRIDRLLSNLGYGSRREVTNYVKAGAFTFGGSVISDASFAIPYDAHMLQEAFFDGEQLDPIAPLTLILHKPRTYTCSHDEQGLLVYDLLPSRWRARDPALSSAGRLDKDSTGLVIMTDDGDFLHRVISPKSHVWKSYRVILRDKLNGNESATFLAGTMILTGDKVPLKPAQWNPDGERSGIMKLQEGRYHQIRRMFASLGNHVEILHRFQIGALGLDSLPEGEYRRLDDNEIQKIFA